MRKLLLTFTAMLFCSIASFAQTEISTKEQFLAIQANGNYILTADIDLGNLGEKTASIISTFSGTLDGNGKTITYQARFTGNESDGNYSLFGSVSGTIDSLNVNGNVTLSGDKTNMNVALICGSLTSSGVIEYCNVSGNVNSTIQVSGDSGGGSDAGLIAGESAGTVKYCIGTGNVVGVGYVGGLIGQMTNGASVLACSFTGSVTANKPATGWADLWMGQANGNFAGGICGHSSNSNNVNIDFCVANASVNLEDVNDGKAEGITCSANNSSVSGGNANVTYCYGTGTINGVDISSDTDIAGNNGVDAGKLYYEGETIENCTKTSAECIVDALNEDIPSSEKDKFYFDVINGEVVLIIGKRPTEEPDQPETPNYTYYRTIKDGGFNEHTTWEASVDGNEPWVQNVAPEGTTANITISEGHRVTVSHDLVITEDYKIANNNGVLQIKQQGQLINETTTNVPGIVEIVSAPKANQKWTFVGAPFQDGYMLGCILPESHDVSVKKYNYSTANWSDEWAHVETPMEAGEGYFAFPFLDAPITFTTYGDVGTYADRGNYGYTSTDTVTALNNDTVKVKKSGEWMALSNPYPAKLKVSKFLSENTGIQGGCTYGYNGTSWDIQNATTGDIAMTEGFFVHFTNAEEKTITFNKGQLSYNNQSAKASANEFIKLTLINGDKKVRAYLAHNEEAEQGYDIFDANKMFAPTEIAEPYFVTDGIALMKEEFAELPYYATMNVRSFADDTVSFVVENIPEGLSVSIIDGENIIDMVEGGVYTTEILTGENADRFKVLIKKSVSISDVEELEVNITNNNRHISIETTETDLQVEVYNALGQKVLSTKDRNFTLNQVSAGAYLIKAFNNKASKTQKIVVE